MTDAKKPDDNPGQGNRPPRTYPVLIDKLHVAFGDPNPSGRELLQAAGKTPVEGYAIYIKQPGAQPKRIQLDERVDLTEPGVERFVTLPLDQTEGLYQGRRHFALPAEDMEWLEGCNRPFELVVESGVMRVVVYEVPVPAGYTTDSVTVHIQVPAGYPDVQLDMVWFSPALALSSGKGIGALCQESFDGETWQRWSRHRTPLNPWRPGIDNLGTHFALIEEWLLREARK